MPKFLAFSIITTALLVSCVLANDVVFFPATACNFALGTVQCGDVPSGFCCTSSNPFCVRVYCTGCAENNNLRSFSTGSCTGNQLAYCVEPGGGAYCCIDGGSGSTCAGQWMRGTASKRDIDSIMSPGNENVQPVDPDKCEQAVQPNKMTYTDAEGVEHEIHLPAGTFEAAVEHIQNQAFDELAKYPTWENQKYTEADYITKPETTG